MQDSRRPFVSEDTPVDDAVLTLIAHLPTRSLHSVVAPGFIAKLTDAQFMRIAVLLAQKSDDEGGCPIGGVVVDNQTRQILGKGHNTLVQEGHPYNHGETSAMRDAGRVDFSTTTMFTTLTPCDVCATLIRMRGFPRVVVGNILNGDGNEAMLREHGIQVDVLPDPLGIAIYTAYADAKPAQNDEDWRGLAHVTKRQANGEYGA